jgi:1-pyrroline-5-carboxylate dehydrogenase
MKVLMDAGLPPGVINFLPFRSERSTKILRDPNFAGLHFTGSYRTFTKLWKEIASNVENYRSFPRIVGETGGKDFIIAHHSADVNNLTVNLIRGAFGYQGQKCSAVSRAYIPESFWPSVLEELKTSMKDLKFGDVDDLENFGGAVIDKGAFDKIVSYIDHALSQEDTYEFILGGDYNDEKGYFIDPTVIRTSDPRSKLMREEIFGPVLTVYVYRDDDFEEILDICDSTSPYGLTGAIFANDRYAIRIAEKKLRFAAGNFYINDKPTGAVVGRQPFGGSRHSGTNDKAGSKLNLLRWLQPRVIKETMVPYSGWKRPFQCE